MSATKVVKTGRERLELVYASKGDSQPVGFISKFANTRTDSHPWKAAKYNGRMILGCPDSDFIGSYFPEEGGKAAAIAAVLAGK